MNHINQMKVNYTGIKDHGFVQDHRGIYHYFVCSKPWPYKWGKKLMHSSRQPATGGISTLAED